MIKEEKTIKELLEDNASFNIYDEEQERLLKKAYEVAEMGHKGQTRDDGTPYIEHPKRVAKIVKEYFNNRGVEAQIIALLHDILEDTNISYEYLDENFRSASDDILVLTRKKGEDYKTYLERVFDGYVNVIIVKIADRIDNIRDLKNCPNEVKRHKYIKETEEVFIPMARSHRYMKQNNSFKDIIDELTKEVEYAKSII